MTLYTYVSDGRKLRAVYRTPIILKPQPAVQELQPWPGGELPIQPISNDTRVDYVGNAVLRNGEADMLLLPGGFMRGDTIYTYVKDYLGNVRCVVREDGELRESNGYYPYGMAIPYGGDIQPYKYGGQSLARRSGRCNVGYQVGGNIQGPPSGNVLGKRCFNCQFVD